MVKAAFNKKRVVLGNQSKHRGKNWLDVMFAVLH